MSSEQISFDDYQAGARQTAGPYIKACMDIAAGARTVNVAKNLQLAYTAIGLAGEAGEFAGKIKKVIRDDQGTITAEKRGELKKELGDVLWYLAECANQLGCNLSDIAESNALKLQDRMERGVLQGSGDNR